MTGREEHAKQLENRIDNLLTDMPEFVKMFYFTLSGLSVTTQYNYINMVIELVRYIKEKGKDINDASNYNIENTLRYYNKYMYTDKNGEKKANSIAVRQNRWFALKKFYQYMVTSGLIEKNPMAVIEKPKGKDNVHRVFMTGNELVNIVNEFEDKCNQAETMSQKLKAMTEYCILKILITTGIRKTALSELNISDVSFMKDENDNIAGCKLNVTDKENKFFEKYLAEQDAKELNDYINLRNKYLVVNEYEQNNALFITVKGNRIASEYITRLVSKVKVDGKHITPHKFRATYATLLYNQTHDLLFVQRQMGHSNPKTTELYIVDDHSGEQKASNYMSSILGGRNGEAEN